MPTVSFQSIIDLIVTIIIPLGLWLFHRARKAETVRIELITDQKAATVKLALDVHEKRDIEMFQQHSQETQKMLAKLDVAESVRVIQHAENTSRLDKLDNENQDKLRKLDALSANMETLMQWFSEWRQSKF